jgi:FkbM family methyltransferase
MPTSPTLTEKLATLGIHLPAWPEEPRGSGATGDWIQSGQAYAEGVRLWRAQLRNAPESTKGVVDLLLQHQENSDQLSPWDMWVSAVIHQEMKKVVTLDRWKPCIALLKDGPLSNAQLLGGLLALADAQQLAGAAIGALRLIKNNPMSDEDALDICALLTSRSDTRWRIAEAENNERAHEDLILLHTLYARLLATGLELKDKIAADQEGNGHKSIITCLDQILTVLGEEDQWSGVPKARALQILNQSGLEATISFLAKRIPWHLPSGTNQGHAKMLVAQMLVDHGNWEEVKHLNDIVIAQLNEYQQAEHMRTSILEIIHTETELLSHELSIALSNRSLEPLTLSKSEETQRWQSLSRSQLGQDLWVLEQLGWKRGGFFVEFGATDGVLLSNSWLLEKHFGWKGICAEPNPKLFKRLQMNRSCVLSPACVYRTSGESMSFVLADAFGGIEDLGLNDEHTNRRVAYASAGHIIQVTTTSLLDLLEQNEAPPIIDYLSIDTEGSELAILEGFDWSAYHIRCITVEHNFTNQRQLIRNLLESQGYTAREAQWDDYYFKDLEASCS